MKEAGDSPGWTRAVRNTNFFPLSGVCWSGSRKRRRRGGGAKRGVEGLVEDNASDNFVVQR